MDGLKTIGAATRATAVTHVEEPRNAEAPAVPAEAGARENRVDEQRAAVNVARHHEGAKSPGMTGPLIHGAAGLTKAVSKGLKSTAALVHDSELKHNLKHGAEVSGKVMEGLAALNIVMAAFEMVQAQRAINEADRAQSEMAKAVKGNAEISANDLKEKSEAVAKSHDAKAARVEAGLTIIKSGTGLAAAGMEVAHIAASAAHLVAGAAAGLVSVAAGGFKIYKASHQTADLNNRMQALDPASRKGSLKGDVAKLKAAADDIKASRAKHISNTKWGGIAKVGFGIASLALLGVALAVTAPVILPILSLGLLATGVAVGVTGVVRGIEKKRSQDKINTLINASVQAMQGGQKLDRDGLDTLVSDGKFKKTADRDRVRAGKINESVFALDSMLKRLAQKSGDSLERVEIIGFLTSSRFVDGPQKQLLKNQLENLNQVNIAQDRGPLLTMLAKQIL